VLVLVLVLVVVRVLVEGFWHLLVPPSLLQLMQMMRTVLIADPKIMLEAVAGIYRMCLLTHYTSYIIHHTSYIMSPRCLPSYIIHHVALLKGGIGRRERGSE
jgi:hypothetical protein